MLMVGMTMKRLHAHCETTPVVTPASIAQEVTQEAAYPEVIVSVAPTTQVAADELTATSNPHAVNK